MRWAMLFGLAWLLVAAIFAALWQWSSRAAHITPAERAASALTRALNHVDRGDRHGRMPAWTVVGATSAHHVMVVDVEATRLQDAKQIATQIVEPLRDRYEEVLIYVRKPGGAKDQLAARRIQWTPRGGYVETIYSP